MFGFYFDLSKSLRQLIFDYLETRADQETEQYHFPYKGIPVITQLSIVGIVNVRAAPLNQHLFMLKLYFYHTLHLFIIVIIKTKNVILMYGMRRSVSPLKRRSKSRCASFCFQKHFLLTV